MDKPARARARRICWLLDLMLPGEDGPVDLPAAARRKEHGPHHHADRRRARTWTASSGWRWEPTTICPSPSNPRELVARINAVFAPAAPRRSPRAPPAVEPEKSASATMTVNLATRTLERERPVRMSLTTGEFACSRFLVTNPRTPLSRDKN